MLSHRLRRWPNIVSTMYLLGVSYSCVKKSYVEQAVAPLLSGTVSKAVAQH